jgi:hypothetical protein
MMAYSKSFPEPSPAFRQTLLTYLKETLPLLQFAGMEPPKPIENLSDKITVLTTMAKRWNVWPDIDQQFQQMQIERQTVFLRAHTANMIAQEHDAAFRGEGRTPIGQQAPMSLTNCPPVEPHLAGCVCRACGGNGNVEGNWSGFIPADPTMPRNVFASSQTEEDDK